MARPYASNKYAGRCVDCSGNVPAGQGKIWKRGRAWMVAHRGACPTNSAPASSTMDMDDEAEPFKTAAFVRGSRSVLFQLNSGAEVFVNRNGRCEDAPCCGCCS